MEQPERIPHRLVDCGSARLGRRVGVAAQRQVAPIAFASDRA